MITIKFTVSACQTSWWQWNPLIKVHSVQGRGQKVSSWIWRIGNWLWFGLEGYHKLLVYDQCIFMYCVCNNNYLIFNYITFYLFLLTICFIFHTSVIKKACLLSVMRVVTVDFVEIILIWWFVHFGWVSETLMVVIIFPTFCFTQNIVRFVYFHKLLLSLGVIFIFVWVILSTINQVNINANHTNLWKCLFQHININKPKINGPFWWNIWKVGLTIRYIWIYI